MLSRTNSRGLSAAGGEITTVITELRSIERFSILDSGERRWGGLGVAKRLWVIAIPHTYSLLSYVLDPYTNESTYLTSHKSTKYKTATSPRDSCTIAFRLRLRTRGISKTYRTGISSVTYKNKKILRGQGKSRSTLLFSLGRVNRP